MRILTPRPLNGVPEAVLANLAGGIAGGDRCEVGVAAGPGAEAIVSGQAAEKVYRAIDAPAEWTTRLTLGPGATLEWLPQETILFDGARLRRRIEVDMAGDARLLAVETLVYRAIDAPAEWTTRLTLGPGATLEWLPQETILFDGARLRRRIEVDMAGDARLLAVETLVFGRAAHGERMVRGGLADRWWIDRDGRPVWRDALRIGNDAFESAAAAQAGLGGAQVFATLIYAAPDAPERLEELRGLLSEMSAFAGASAVRGLVALRFLAGEGGAFKRELAGLLGAFRASVFDRPALPPRVWLC